MGILYVHVSEKRDARAKETNEREERNATGSTSFSFRSVLISLVPSTIVEQSGQSTPLEINTNTMLGRATNSQRYYAPGNGPL